MVMRKAKFILLGLFVSSFSSWAQNGTIRGSAIEDATGDPLMGVTVVVEGTTNGAATDFDGKFEISMAPGTYNITVTFISFQKVSVKHFTSFG